MSKKEDIKKQIDELQNAALVASLNYEVWWTYKERESRKKYIDTMDCYTLFFRTSIHAHFVALIIVLYRLYETRRDTVNIPGLIRLLEESGIFAEKTLKEAQKLYEQTKGAWISVCKLRNWLFAHRSKKYSVTEVFQKAKVKPNALRELMEKTEEILNIISYDWDGSTYLFDLRSQVSDDTTRLLEALTQLRKIHTSAHCKNN